MSNLKSRVSQIEKRHAVNALKPVRFSWDLLDALLAQRTPSGYSDDELAEIERSNEACFDWTAIERLKGQDEQPTKTS